MQNKTQNYYFPFNASTFLVTTKAEPLEMAPALGTAEL